MNEKYIVCNYFGVTFVFVYLYGTVLLGGSLINLYIIYEHYQNNYNF